MKCVSSAGVGRKLWSTLFHGDVASIDRALKRRWKRGMLRLRQLLQPAGLIEQRFENGLRMRFRSDDYIGTQVYLNGRFEGEVAAFIRKNVGRGNVAVDLGANIGLFTLVLANAVGETGNVYAFEPSPRERALLKENVLLNGFQNVIIEDLAVGESDHVEPLHLAVPSCSGLNALGGIYFGDSASGEKVDVHVIDFDSYWRCHGKDRLDFIKLDVEGSELDFLRGARNTMREYRPLLVLEFSDLILGKRGQRTSDLREELADLGYESLGLDQDGALSKVPLSDYCECANVLARPCGVNRPSSPRI